MTEPCYLELSRSGELEKRRDAALKILHACRLCPRECKVDRTAGKTGFCRSGRLAMVASDNLHHGEEPVISGTRGSGTIFFSNCTLHCRFCQNYPISQLGVGREMTAQELADAMLKLQKRGAHNVNLVTPTHYVPQFIEALVIAVENGFRLPIVYNTNGFDSFETLAILDGIVDIYLPDAKYSSEEHARECSRVSGYVQSNRSALKEMFRQVGDLQTDEHGIAVRGLVIRHLVLPDGLSDTPDVLAWLANELSRNTHISLMSQYFPAHEALKHRLLCRKITFEEYEAALDAFEEAGLENGWLQEFEEASF